MPVVMLSMVILTMVILRYSTPYFFSPARDAILEPLQALGVGEPLYRTFTWREYIQGRIDDNYTDLGEDDIQISQFKIGSAG